RQVDMASLSPQDRREFQIAWNHFLTRSAVWPLYRDEWLKKGGAAPYVLSENLFTHYFRAVLSNRRGELPRVAETAQEIGEPAVAYFAKALVTDSWPLKRPITTEVMDPDDLNARKKKTFHQFVMDDETRRWTAGILASIGEPAVPTLSSPAVLRRAHKTSRRYAAYALGRIGTPEAVDALVVMLQSSPNWEDRAAAATALGQTVDASTRAREVLLQAAETDTDRFVRKKANRALASADEVKFW
ncbi:MAG: HEAT repeat domain-containing protein, partial [Planctomycetota bacterium]|nr:HEAT repeat domain-containing protein [Planctomycetota bacterium]